MFREHVLIIRRSKLHYTASGIITPIGGRAVQMCLKVYLVLQEIKTVSWAACTTVM
jgi:hypothetical protein